MTEPLFFTVLTAFHIGLHIVLHYYCTSRFTQTHTLRYFSICTGCWGICLVYGYDNDKRVSILLTVG